MDYHTTNKQMMIPGYHKIVVGNQQLTIGDQEMRRTYCDMLLSIIDIKLSGSNILSMTLSTSFYNYISL